MNFNGWEICRIQINKSYSYCSVQFDLETKPTFMYRKKKNNISFALGNPNFFVKFDKIIPEPVVEQL